MSAQVAPQSDQVALVTGASRGIGYTIADTLARAGARAVLLARSGEALAEAAARIGDRALPVRADVTDPAAVENAVAQAEERLGPITLLVHNAGTANVIGPLWEADPETWWAEVAGHLRGAMLTCRAVIPGMLRRGRGRIVLLYGNLGEGADPWCSAYASGKAGLLRLVDHLAAELADEGIGVFGLHPGLVWTPMTAKLAEEASMRRWLPRFSTWPRERYGTADAAAGLVLRIARGDADRLSGLLLSADDELGELSEQADRLRADQRRTLRTTW